MIVTHDRQLVGHNVADAHTTESLDGFKLRVSRTRGVKEKPANERQPQTAEARAVKETKESEDDKCKRNELADRCGHARGARRASGNPPNDRAQHATTVERESRNHIEDRQGDVDYPKPSQHRRPW